MHNNFINSRFQMDTNFTHPRDFLSEEVFLKMSSGQLFSASKSYNWISWCDELLSFKAS